MSADMQFKLLFAITLLAVVVWNQTVACLACRLARQEAED